MKQKKVLLGMSGGVDSSVAALTLKKQGCKVIGAFLCSYPNKSPLFDIECPFAGDNKLAQKIAAKLKIPFIEIDTRSNYLNKVINPMINSYAKGLTPNPDTYCNKITKFPALWKEAKKLGADYIATGHYARLKKTNSGFQLLAGKDKTKDQSYFLYQLSQSTLSHTLFPNGNLKKTETREIAKRNKFPNWNKKSSTGICFIGKKDMKSLLRANIPEKQGPVIDAEGKEIGTHPGAHFFTIGERIGERHNVIINKKYKNKTKLYVAEKKANTLLVATKNSPLLKRKKITIKSMRLINPKEPIPKDNIKARIRHLGSLLPGKLKKQKNKYIFTLKKPTEALAEGQAIVLYHKQKVIGGGEMLKLK